MGAAVYVYPKQHIALLLCINCIEQKFSTFFYYLLLTITFGGDGNMLFLNVVNSKYYSGSTEIVYLHSETKS